MKIEIAYKPENTDENWTIVPENMFMINDNDIIDGTKNISFQGILPNGTYDVAYKIIDEENNGKILSFKKGKLKHTNTGYYPGTGIIKTLKLNLGGFLDETQLKTSPYFSSPGDTLSKYIPKMLNNNYLIGLFGYFNDEQNTNGYTGELQIQSEWLPEAQIFNKSLVIQIGVNLDDEITQLNIILSNYTPVVNGSQLIYGGTWVANSPLAHTGSAGYAYNGMVAAGFNPSNVTIRSGGSPRVRSPYGRDLGPLIRDPVCRAYARGLRSFKTGQEQNKCYLEYGIGLPANLSNSGRWSRRTYTDFNPIINRHINRDSIPPIRPIWETPLSRAGMIAEYRRRNYTVSFR